MMRGWQPFLKAPFTRYFRSIMSLAPGARSRASISRDFKSLVSRLGITSVHTRRNHPETNGKAERWVGVLRQEALRVTPPTSFAEAERVVGEFVDYYNRRRLHAGIRFLRPAD